MTALSTITCYITYIIQMITKVEHVWSGGGGGGMIVLFK